MAHYGVASQRRSRRPPGSAFAACRYAQNSGIHEAPRLSDALPRHWAAVRAARAGGASCARAELGLTGGRDRPDPHARAADRRRTRDRPGQLGAARRERHRRQRGDVPVQRHPEAHMARSAAGIRPARSRRVREALPGCVSVRRDISGLVPAGRPRERIRPVREARRAPACSAGRYADAVRVGERDRENPFRAASLAVRCADTQGGLRGPGHGRFGGSL